MTEIKSEEIKPGMYIKISQIIKDKDKEKTQNIEGLVIAKKHGKEPGATITLRRIMDGVGVEWILPVFSSKIKRIELVRAARVRRSKLYFLRDKSQKQIRAKLKKEIK